MPLDSLRFLTCSAHPHEIKYGVGAAGIQLRGASAAGTYPDMFWDDCVASHAKACSQSSKPIWTWTSWSCSCPVSRNQAIDLDAKTSWSCSCPVSHEAQGRPESSMSPHDSSAMSLPRFLRTKQARVQHVALRLEHHVTAKVLDSQPWAMMIISLVSRST